MVISAGNVLIVEDATYWYLHGLYVITACFLCDQTIILWSSSLDNWSKKKMYIRIDLQIKLFSCASQRKKYKKTM